MIKAVIAGASGYTGLELLRILASHPDVTVTGAGSRQYAGADVSSVFPALRGFYDGLRFSAPDELDSMATGAEVAFAALPHGASQEAVKGLLSRAGRVIDLSADFRIHDREVYTKWYGEHNAPELLAEAAYGLPELHRDAIKAARLVANPGCYPTGATLALAPLAALAGDGVVDARSIVVDSKSGASGAGRAASLATSFVEVTGGFKAYKVGCHRHTPEMEQELTAVAGAPITVTFTPHLLPVSRGILTTAYATLNETITTEALHALYSEFYAGEPFVRLLPEGEFPDISQVRCSNYCDIGVFVDEERGRATVISAIDNLVKGASGQAVQNMNIMMGFDEDTALRFPPASI